MPNDCPLTEIHHPQYETPQPCHRLPHSGKAAELPTAAATYQTSTLCTT
jgi:hypothetical protein